MFDSKVGFTVLNTIDILFLILSLLLMVCSNFFDNDKVIIVINVVVTVKKQRNDIHNHYYGVLENEIVTFRLIRFVLFCVSWSLFLQLLMFYSNNVHKKWSVYNFLEWKIIFQIWKALSSFLFDVNCEEFMSCGELENFSYFVIFQIELVLVQI